MLRFLSAILLALAVPLHAQRISWDIGASDRRPTFDPGAPSVVLSPAGALVAWNDGSGVVGRRLDITGKPLETEPFTILAGARRAAGDTIAQNVEPEREAVALTADDTSYFVMADGCIARVDVATGAVQRLPGSSGIETPRALAWNGTNFAVIYDDPRPYQSPKLVMLDRDGAVATGTIDLHQAAAAMTVSWAPRTWFVTARGNAARVDPATFPPIGTERDLEFARYVRGDYGILDPRPGGFVAAWLRDDLLHTCVTDLTPGCVSSTKRLYRDSFAPRRAALSGDTIVAFGVHAASPTLRYGLAQFPAGTYPYGSTFSLPPVLGASGRAVDAAADDERWVFAGATTEGHIASVQMRRPEEFEESSILNWRPPMQSKPRLASAGTAVIALYQESEFTTGQSLLFAMLGPDGHQLARERKLAKSVGDSAVASDGHAFLAVWSEQDAVYGAVISSAGDIVRARYALAATPSSSAVAVLWDGTAYVVRTEDRLLRVASTGDVLEENVFADPVDAIDIAWDGQRLSGVGVKRDGCPLSRCAVAEGATDVHRYDGNAIFSQTTLARCGTAAVAAARGTTVFVMPDFARAEWVVSSDDRGEIARYPSIDVQPHAVATSYGFLLAGASRLARFGLTGPIDAFAIPNATGEIAVTTMPDGAAIVMYERENARLATERIELTDLRRRAARH